MADKVTVFVEGTVYWAKIVGDGALHLNYDGDARQWSYELVPDDTTFLKDNKLLDRLKSRADERNPDKGDFIVLKKPEFTKDGEKNEPIRIYDGNEPWDNRLIGNGSRVVAKLQIVNWGPTKKKSIYTQALRITDLVPYEGSDFGDYDGGVESVKPEKATKKPVTKKNAELDDLDSDEIPF